MSSTSFSGRKIAMMVAHGFDETCFIGVQKMLMGQNAIMKVVSPNVGLVNGISDGQITMNYPVDSSFSETLAVDFDALIIPAGDTHISTLMDELHAARIIRAFMREDMPVLVVGNALDVVAEVITDIDRTSLKAEGRADALVYVTADGVAESGRLLSDAFEFSAAAQAEAEAEDDSAAA